MARQITIGKTYRLRIEKRKSTKGEKVYYSIHLPKIIENFGWKAGDMIEIIVHFTNSEGTTTPILILKNISLDYRMLKSNNLDIIV